MTSVQKKEVVIVGAGFAGLRLAKKLAAESRNYCHITLLDRHNYHQFQPLMYQVATARMEPETVAFPLRREFQSNRFVEIRLATVAGVDAEKGCLNTSIGAIRYDLLVLCTGCKTNFYGKNDIESNALSICPDFISRELLPGLPGCSFI